MRTVKSRYLLLIMLLLASVCIGVFLLLWQRTGEGDRQTTGEMAPGVEGDGQATGEIAEEALPEEVEGDGQVAGEIRGEALPEEVEGDGQVRVRIAGEAFPLLFETDSIPLALKRTIATDLGRALSYLDEARFEKLNRTRRLSRGNEDLEVTHRLVTKGPGPKMLPDPLKRDFGGAVKSNDGYGVVVRTTVIEEYARAAELREKRPEMFAELGEFIDLLNDHKRLKEISRNWEACADYVYRFRGAHKEIALGMVRGYARLEQKVRYPSLLDIIPLSAGEPGAPEGSYAMGSLIEYEFRGVKTVGKLPLGVYVNGKWRIFTLHMP